MMEKDMGAIPGSREPIPDGLGPSGFDPARIPPDIAEAVLRMGRVEWGYSGPHADAEHVSNFANSLGITREHFELGDEPRELHGVYLEGTETVLCHTGTSPNSPVNACALAGAWNWLVAIATEARRAETTGSVHEGAGPQDIAQESVPSSDMGKGE